MPPWRRCSRLPDVLVPLAEGPPGRADLARRRAITLQAGSHTGGPGTRSGPLLAIAAGQAARNGLCRPPGGVSAAEVGAGLAALGLHRRTVYTWLATERTEGHQALRARPVPGR